MESLGDEHKELYQQGPRDADSRIWQWGKNIYSFLTLQVSPPLIVHNGSVYSPQMGNGESNHSVSKHIEGNQSSYMLLDKGNSKYFCF